MSAFYKFDVETAPKTVKHSRKGDGNKENKRIRKPSEIKWKNLIEELRNWMSTQDINLVYVNRIGWNGPRNRVLAEVMYRLQLSVKQVPLPAKMPLPEVAKQIEALRALMVKQDNKERERLKDDFVQTWNPEGTKCEVLQEAMRRLGGPVPVPSHDGLGRSPVAVQAVHENQRGGHPLETARVKPPMASKEKKRKLENDEYTASKKRQGKKRRVEDNEDAASKKRRFDTTTTTPGHGMPETMSDFIEGSSSGGNRNDYAVYPASPRPNEYWDAPHIVKPSPSNCSHHKDAPHPANMNLGSSARPEIVPVDEGSGTSPRSQTPLLYAVDSGLPPTPSCKQNPGQAHCNPCTSPPGPAALQLQHAEQTNPQRQVGYAHESNTLNHMSYPSSQTGDAGITQEISAVLPHGQDPILQDDVELGDEEEENTLETETTYDWSREQDMFVQTMVDPPSNVDSEEMDERWNALMQDDTVLEWWDRMRVPEEMWDKTWGEMLKSEDGTQWWNAM